MITTSLAGSFLLEALQGVHQPADEYRIALYTSDAELGPATTAYTPAGEASGPGYKAGGQALSGYKAAGGAKGAGLSWADPTWPTATITARAALIYNASKGNRAVATLDLGKNFTSTNGSFTVALPDRPVGLGE